VKLLSFGKLSISATGLLLLGGLACQHAKTASESHDGAAGAVGSGGAGTGAAGTTTTPAPDATTTGEAGSGAAGDAVATPDAHADAPITDAPTEAATGSGCGAPGTLCWDFEGGKLPDGWTAYRNEYTGDLVVDDTRPHRGTYSLHAKDFKGGAEGAQGGPKKTLRYALPAGFGPTLWGRAFIYTTPARAMSHAGFFNARYPRPNAAAGKDTAIDTLDWYEAATYMSTYMSIWHPPEPPGYPEDVQVTTTPIVLDAWACLEWEFDAANGDAPEAAEPRMWLDGVELAWPDTFIYPDGAARPKHEKATNFTVLEAGIYLYQGLPTVTNWWIDDLAVGRERIGCGP
jgi:hypothetical protein